MKVGMIFVCDGVKRAIVRETGRRIVVDFGSFILKGDEAYVASRLKSWGYEPLM